jgi:hypothetical protein
MLSKGMNGLSNFHKSDCRLATSWLKLGLAIATTTSLLNPCQPARGSPPSCPYLVRRQAQIGLATKVEHLARTRALEHLEALLHPKC